MPGDGVDQASLSTFGESSPRFQEVIEEFYDLRTASDIERSLSVLVDTGVADRERITRRRREVSEDYKKLLDSSYPRLSATTSWLWSGSKTGTCAFCMLTCLERCCLKPRVESTMLKRLVDSTYFKTAATFSEYERKTQGFIPREVVLPNWLLSIDVVFSVVFGMELLLRLLAQECSFFHSKEWGWNMLDAALVCLSFSEGVLLASAGVDFRWIKVFRVLRMMRILRIIRLVRWLYIFHTLRLMLVAMSNSFTALTFGVLALGVWMFLFSVVFLQGVSQYIEGAPLGDSNAAALRDHFLSLPMANLTLFMAITGGIDWSLVATMLMKIHWIYLVLFTTYIAITMLGALNIITGLFVHEAVEMARLDKDVMREESERQQNHKMATLTKVFKTIDRMNRGFIDKEDFVHALGLLHVQQSMRSVGIDVADPHYFFERLDANEDLTLEIDEFVIGCMRVLHQEAVAIEVAAMSQSNKRNLKSLHLNQAKIAERCEAIASRVEAVYSVALHQLELTRLEPSDRLWPRSDSSERQGGSGLLPERSRVTSNSGGTRRPVRREREMLFL